VSDILGANNANLFMYWCLYGLSDSIYHIDDLDIIVLYKRAGDLLTIFDVVGRKVPEFAQIYPYISGESDRAVEFRFMVDRLGLKNFEQEAVVQDNGTHLMGNFPLEGTEFLFPFTAQA